MQGYPRETGPQVYGIAYCRVSYAEELSGLGFFGQSASPPYAQEDQESDADPSEADRYNCSKRDQIRKL